MMVILSFTVTKRNENVILDVWHNGLPPELFRAAAPRYLPSVRAP